MTEENSEVQSFDIEKYRVSSELIPQKIKIESTGDEFEIKLRPLSWSKRSQMMSEHVKMKISGDPEFDSDGFMRACLKEVIVEAPWGRTTEAFLLSIDARLGRELEKLIPTITGEGEEESPEEIKKGV